MLSGTTGNGSTNNVRISTKSVNDSIQAQYILELQDIQQQAIAALNNLSSTLLADIQNLYNQLSADLSQECQDCKDELAALKAQYETDLQNLIDSGTQALNTLGSNLQAQLNADFLSYTTQMNAIVTQFNTDVQNLLQSLQTQLLNDLNAHIATLTTLASTLETQIQNFAQNQQIQISTYLTDLQTTIENSMSTLGAQLLTDLQTQYDQHETDLNAIVSAFNTTASNYDTLFQSYLSQAQQLLNDTIQAAAYEVMPIGSVVSFHSLSIPPNYLLCDGAVYDTNTYASLFAVLGINVTPDLRGVFIRGWDPAAVNDPQGATRSFGDFQADDVESHTHSGTTDSAGDTSGTFTGNTDPSPVTLRVNNTAGATNPYVFEQDEFFGSLPVQLPESIHSHSFSVPYTLPAHTHTFTTTANGSSSETRPKNVTMIFMIKAV